MTFNAGGDLSRGGKGREMNWHVDWNVRQSELKLSREFRDRKRVGKMSLELRFMSVACIGPLNMR